MSTINKIDKYPIPEKCPYCFEKVKYTSNSEVYGKEYGNGKCYRCIGCNAYVGVHTGTNIPLGILANKELRELKKKAHNIFDETWTSPKEREKRYLELANSLNIDKTECHFGWFNKEMLEKAIKILEK